MLAEHLKAIDDATTEKDLVIILISGLPGECNYLITALETIVEEKLEWDYVRDRLIHEAQKMSRGLLDSTNPDASHDSLVVKTDQKLLNATFANEKIITQDISTKVKLMQRTRTWSCWKL